MDPQPISQNSSAQPADTPLSNGTPLVLQIAQLRMILEVSRSLNSTLNLDALLDLIIEVATEATKTEAASILLLDENTGELHFEAATGAKRAEVKAIGVPLEGSIAGWIYSHNQSLVVNDARQDPRHYARADRTTQFDTRSILGVPLQVKDKTIGVLEVVNKLQNARFTAQDLETLETLAAQAAIAIENARLYQDLQDQMQTLKQTRTRLLQSEKLAAVGELVAGVAHELNNPLTSIIGFASMLQLNPLDEQGQADLEKILTQARRAAGIVRGLLDFARQRPPEHRPIQVNAVLNSTLELVGYELRTHNIEHTTCYDSNLPPIMADPYQLQQVFVNLINNARQALAEANGGGHLTITTEIGPSKFIDKDSETEPVIRVIFQDDGPGIAPHLLSSIFDPFFTTKPEGQGTGLGLSVCHGIINEHRGHIWAESEPGAGATFFVELPITAPKIPPSLNRPNGATRHATRRPSAKKARILVIDDETGLLEFLVRTLEFEGYQVDAVSNGETALTRMAESNYELVICDVRMPGLSGPEVYRRAQTQQLDVSRRFMFITGDSVSPTTRNFLEQTGVSYMCKPFGMRDLVRRVRASLEPEHNGGPRL